jgi:hypothetical protein
MALKGTLESRIAYRIKRSGAVVFMRQDFDDIGGYDQIGRILRQLVAKGLLLSVGYGLYARARKSSISGKTIPEKTLWDLTDEFLQKRKIASAPSRTEMAYNSGLSTQVPTGRTVGVRGRVSRKIGYDGKYISFEKVS